MGRNSGSGGGRGGSGGSQDKADLDNHGNQLNPNNDAYWTSREYDERPGDWQERSEEK